MLKTTSIAGRRVMKIARATCAIVTPTSTHAGTSATGSHTQATMMAASPQAIWIEFAPTRNRSGAS